MSWSDDTRCLYCDGKLPLYRKITSGQFCSANHRKAYWQEQERLAVERLHQTHDSLRAYRPPEALDVPRREPVAPPPPPPPPPISAKPVSFVEYAYQEGPSVEDRARSASNTGQVTFAGFLVDPGPEPRNAALPISGLDLAEWLTEELSHQRVIPRLSVSLDTPEWSMDLEPEINLGAPVPFFEAAQVDSLDIAAIKPGSARLLLSPVLKNAQVGMRLNSALETPEFETGFIAEPIAAVIEVAAKPEVPEAATEADLVAALSAALLPLQKIAARSPETVAQTSAQPLLTADVPVSAPHAIMPRRDAVARTSGAPAAGLVPLDLNTVPCVQPAAPRGAEPSALALSSNFDNPQHNFELPVLGPELRLAPGSRYALSGGNVPVSEAAVAGELPQLVDLARNAPHILGLELEPGLALAPGCQYKVSINPGKIEKAAIRKAAPVPVPAKSQIAMAALPADLGVADLAPAFPRMKALGFKADAKAADSVQPLTGSVAHTYPENPPMHRATRWEPIEGELHPAPKTGFLSTWSQAMSQVGEGKDGEKKYVWAHVADFWQHAPRDLKLLSIAIPVLLGLALRPSLPKVKVTAPVASHGVETSSFQRGLKERLMVVRQTVAERAGVELNEDFRSGLDDWQTRGDLSHAWSFDPNGFVKPGALALYRPSIGLKDYEMEFLGLIDKKALSWVVRASDFNNYYVVKLVLLKPGPMPTLGITRYAVINGKAQDRVDTVAPINARTDTLYRVNLNVRDDTYLLTLQGQIVDNWTESRLTSGGVGFFSQQGEESRLRWVQVTHQYDMLGRLCAYLAPTNISNTNGSW